MVIGRATRDLDHVHRGTNIYKEKSQRRKDLLNQELFSNKGRVAFKGQIFSAPMDHDNIGGILKRLGDVLGAFWGVLGASWGVLVRLGSFLGRLEGVFKRPRGSSRHFEVFGGILRRASATLLSRMPGLDVPGN